MKKWMFRSIIAFLVMMNSTANAQQGRFRLDLNYVVGVPVGNLSSLVNQVSPRGWQAAVMYDINEKLAVGIATGMQDFYQKYPRTVIHSEGQDISAVVTNSIQVNPVMLKGQYNFGEPGKVQPYMSLAAGANFASYNKYYGEFNNNNAKVGFAAQAGAGVTIPLKSYRIPAIHFGADYNLLPYKAGDANGFSFLGLKAGISLLL